MDSDKIDFVILWVDGNDEEWQKEKRKYDKEIVGEANSKIRYRDWKTLKYWFRGIEKFTPWVNKVYLVTCGQKPDWINEKCEKLQLISHKDFMPEEALPSFSSSAIEIGINKIKGLSENIVFFNDDTFIVNHMEKDDFFHNGLPRDCFIFNSTSAQKKNNIIEHIVLNDMEVLANYFDKNKVIKDNFFKIYNFKYGAKMLKSVLLKSWKFFTGVENQHIPLALKKSTMDEVWEKEEKRLLKTQCRKFRSNDDNNIYLFRYWQLFSGKFVPTSMKKNMCYHLQNNNKTFFDEILKGKYNMVCINDANEDIDFESVSSDLNKMFEKLLPNKSEFEL